MRGFLQKVASNVPFSNILNHRVWWVVESGSNGRWFLWEWLLTLRILLDEREWTAICAGWQRDPRDIIYVVQKRRNAAEKIRFFLQKKGVYQVLILLFVCLARFGEVRKRFELLLLCNKPTSCDDQTMVFLMDPTVVLWWCSYWILPWLYATACFRSTLQLVL